MDGDAAFCQAFIPTCVRKIGGHDFFFDFKDCFIELERSSLLRQEGQGSCQGVFNFPFCGDLGDVLFKEIVLVLGEYSVEQGVRVGSTFSKEVDFVSFYYQAWRG